MNEVAIRKMKSNDLETVSELAMLANPFAEKEEYRKHLEEELENMAEFAFVAVRDRRVVGYVMGDVHGSHATLEDIAVDKPYQGQGIGTQLLETELKAINKSSRSKIVVAEVHYKCASAIPFYYKHSFRISGVCRNFFGMDHDAIILELILAKTEKQ
ncbi:MAG: GNAT family N-acetyltransferase [Candidatus Bathyarchaeia archaeon]